MAVGDKPVKTIKKSGQRARRNIIFAEGSNLTITESVDSDDVTWTFAATGGGGGGTLDHAALTSNLAWTSSAHTGTAAVGTIAGFNGAGAAAYYAIGTDIQAYNASLAAIAAGTWTGAASITTLGTIGTGVWQGTTVAAGYGGTGLTGYTTGDLLYASATNVLSALAAGTSGYVLTSNGAGTAPSWQAAGSGSISALVWHPDVTPTGLDAGYERGDGTGGLSLWNAPTVSETSFGLSCYGGTGIYWATPATQWSITTYAAVSGTNTAYRTAGIFVAENVVTNPTTANLNKFILEIDGSGEPSIQIQTWTAYNVFSSNIFSITGGIGYRAGIYMRVTSNGVSSGSNWYFLVSYDGIAWLEIASGTWSNLGAGASYAGVVTGGASGEPAIYPWVRRRSGASEYRAPHIEGGIIA